MTEQEQIDALKAQVNCLREELQHVANCFFEVGNDDYIFKLLKATPEQCLLEVKAKAIEDATLRADDGSGWCFEGDLSRFAKTLREQAKCVGG